VPDEALVAVLKKASETLGAQYYKTPRDIVRSFVGLLNVLEQNPNRKWQEFLHQDLVKPPEKPLSVEEEIAREAPPVAGAKEELASFKL
jgi:hypothetical protein